MGTQIESLRRFLARHGPAPTDNGGTTLVVGGGKGGIGTSSIAALLALRAAADGRRVLLVDAEDAPGTLHLYLGVEAGHGLAAIRGGSLTPRDLAVEVADRLALITGWSAEDAGDAPLAPAERRALLRRIASMYDAFDLTIVDAGSRLEGVMAAASAGAQQLLVVTGPDRVALAATHALVKVAAARTPQLPVSTLFNGCDEAEARGAFAVLRTGVEHFLARSVEFAGAVPYDPAFRQAVADGHGLPEAAHASTVADSIRRLDGRVVLERFAGPTLARAVTIPHAKG